jgi:beta-lactamase class A
LDRRHFLSSLASAAVLGCVSGRVVAGAPAEADQGTEAIQARLRELETAAQGRLGIHIFDSETGQEYGYRSDERFMMLSSFKLLASALVLHRVDVGQESLDRRIAYTKDDLVPWSPITEKHADGRGMTLGELCEATITTSDNTAANLILASYGGPPALTAYVRLLGDGITRLDRFEPHLNEGHAGNLLDTTTPRAMLATMQMLVLGESLSTASRAHLQHWLLANTTGGKRLKAGLPADWRIGDKTGTNGTAANDVGVIWPANRAPILVAAYLAESEAASHERDAALAAVGTLIQDIVA